MTLKAFVESASDRQSETEHNAEQSLGEVQTLFLELLNNPEKRSDFIYDSFILDGFANSSLSVSEDSATETWELIADLVEMPFDELNSIPVLERSTEWQLAAQIQTAAASMQAQIMSGLVSQSLADGVENGKDLAADAKGLSRKQLEGVHTEMSKRMSEKKKAKKEAAKNGSV